MVGSKPTLRDVAADAGVSHMTVSRVLRGVAVVSRRTTERVKASVERLGYRPDPALSMLAHRRRHATRAKTTGPDIAFLGCDESTYTAQMALAVTREAAWFGHTVEVLRMPDHAEERKKLAQRLAHRRVEGLVIGPAPKALDLSDWNWTRFAAVAVGIMPHRPTMHAVSAEYFEGFLTAESALRAEGARPGLCLRAFIDLRSGRRWTGASRSCDWLPPPLVFQDKMDLRTRVGKWARKHRLTHVLTTEAIYEPIYHGAGLQVGYLGHYGAPEGAGHLAFDTEDLGREATRLLHHALLRRDFGPPRTPQIVGLRAQWVPAATVPNQGA